MNDHKKVCNSCAIYIVLFVIALLIIIGITSVFIYFYWYLKRDTSITNINTGTETVIYWTYKKEISNKLILKVDITFKSYYFFNDVINIKDFDSHLLKIDKKWYKNIDIYYIRYIIIKEFDYLRINSVNP